MTFDDSGWDDASVLAAPDAVLRAETIPPVKETATIEPVKVTDVGTSLPVPSFTDSPTPDWIWNTPNSSGNAASGTIYLRKTFTTPAGATQAVLRINVDNEEVTYVNGTQVASGNDWTTSQTVDITKDLNPAGQTNVIAVAATNVGEGPAGVIAAVQIDGSSPQRIVTDTSWKAWPASTANPPVSATPPASNWNTVGFDDSAWENAFSTGAYGISPWGSVQPPVPPGKVYDFGITTSGWARITLQATAGTEVDIRYSEQLNSDGTVASEGANAQTDTYIAKGGGPETYEPKYGWKGYRYIQVWTPSGADLQIDSIEGIVVHTDLAADGSFTSSSSLLNTMHAAMVNTILNNQYSYGSDTPVYEKGGWTNDNGDYATSEMDNFDAEPYYDHMMQNFDDSQDLSGNIGFLVPTPPGDDQVDPLWGGSFLLLEYDMYQHYDNLAVIRRDYSYMAAYIDDLAAQIAPSGDIYQGTTFGDWSVPPNDPNPPSSEMLGSMFLYRESMDLSIMASGDRQPGGREQVRESRRGHPHGRQQDVLRLDQPSVHRPGRTRLARGGRTERPDHLNRLRSDRQRVRPGVRPRSERRPAGDRGRSRGQCQGVGEPPGHWGQRVEVHPANADQVRLRRLGLPRRDQSDRSRLGAVVPAVRRNDDVGGVGRLILRHSPLARPRLHGHGRRLDVRRRGRDPVDLPGVPEGRHRAERGGRAHLRIWRGGHPARARELQLDPSRQPLRPDRPRSSGLHCDRLRPGSWCRLGDRGRSPGGPRGRSDRHRHAGLMPAAQGRLGQLPLRLAAVLENGRRAHPRVFA